MKKHLNWPDLAIRPFFWQFFMISQATDMLDQKNLSVFESAHQAGSNDTNIA